MRVLLDTNVIVSAVTSRGLCADLFRAVLSDHELVICPQVLHEVRQVLRTKFSVPDDLVAEYLELLTQDAIIVEPGDLPDVPIKDKDDIGIVGAALAGKVDVLIAGDSELQGLKRFRKLRILSPRAFWKELTGA
jgi:putative PIN family toxin of toxin-antitoxin system